jgi:hypothetical protein
MRFLTVKESPQTKLFVANGLPGGHGQNYESGGQEGAVREVVEIEVGDVVSG